MSSSRLISLPSPSQWADMSAPDGWPESPLTPRDFDELLMAANPPESPAAGPSGADPLPSADLSQPEAAPMLSLLERRQEFQHRLSAKRPEDSSQSCTRLEISLAECERAFMGPWSPTIVYAHAVQAAIAAASATDGPLIAGQLTRVLCDTDPTRNLVSDVLIQQLIGTASPCMLHSALVQPMRAVRGFMWQSSLLKALENGVLQPWAHKQLGGLGSLSHVLCPWMARVGVLEGWLGNTREYSADEACATFSQQLVRAEPHISRVLSRFHCGRLRAADFEREEDRVREAWPLLSAVLACCEASKPFVLDWLIEMDVEPLQQLGLAAMALALIEQKVDWSRAREMSGSAEGLLDLARALDPEASEWLQSRGLGAAATLRHLVEHPLIILRRANIQLAHLKQAPSALSETALTYPWPFWSLSRCWANMGNECQGIDPKQGLSHGLLLRDHGWLLPQIANVQQTPLKMVLKTLRPRFPPPHRGNLLDPSDVCTPDGKNPLRCERK
jgi:hypothetical protein